MWQFRTGPTRDTRGCVFNFSFSPAALLLGYSLGSWFSCRGVINFAVLGGSSQCKQYKCMPILNYLPSWLKNSRLAKLNGLHCLHFPMGRFAWVTVFAILCGTLALRQKILRRCLLCFQDMFSFRNVYKNWVWKSSHKKSLNWTSFSSKSIFRAKGPFLAKIRMEFSNSPLPHPATWLADELMRLEHNLDVKEKGKHCCATWTAKNPTPTYCTVPASSSCLAWGQKATVRDYSTVDDKMCEGKGRCWRHRKVPGDLNQTCLTSKKWAEQCDSLGPDRLVILVAAFSTFLFPQQHCCWGILWVHGFHAEVW